MSQDKDAMELDWDVEIETCFECGGDGYVHDCGEDICFCLNPEPNVKCSQCLGKGYL